MGFVDFTFEPAHRRGFRCGFFSTLNVAFESLEPRNLLAASAVISEFLASNSTNIVDQDGNHSDWIELQNTTTSAVNLVAGISPTMPAIRQSGSFHPRPLRRVDF